MIYRQTSKPQETLHYSDFISDKEYSLAKPGALLNFGYLKFHGHK